MLGLALRGESRPLEAYTSFVAATNHCPDSLAAVEGAAETAYARRMPEARALLARVVELRPEDDSSRHARSTSRRAGECAERSKTKQESSAIEGNASALRHLAAASPLSVAPLRQSCSFSPAHAARQKSQSAALARAQKDAVAPRSSRHPPASPRGDSHDSAALLLAAEIAEADNQTPQAIDGSVKRSSRSRTCRELSRLRRDILQPRLVQGRHRLPRSRHSGFPQMLVSIWPVASSKSRSPSSITL